MEFKLPDLGEGIHEAQVISVLVKEGDVVAEDAPLMEVETDKAAVEIPSPVAGKVSRIHVQAGQTVNVGMPLVTFEEVGEPAKAEPRETPEKEAAPARERPEQKEAAPAAARGGDGPARQVAAAAGRRFAATVETRDASRPVPAAPAVRRLAREMNVDLRRVPGSGPGGRVLKQDVEAFAAGRLPPAESAARAAPPEAPAPGPAPVTELPPVERTLPDFGKWGPIRRQPITQIRKTIARQMTRAWTLIPHVTHCDNADLTELEEQRRQLSAELEKKGGPKLTFTAVLLKALAGALRTHPVLNASFDADANEIIFKQYVHIGVAVDTERGLVVPVIRDVDGKTLVQVSAALADVAQRARAAQFTIDELRGGTFTVTNVGALGGTFLTPMINWPEVAILGTGRADWQPVVRNDAIVKRFLMPLSLSFDHRVVDGADAARFLKDVIGYLENPLRLLTVG